jgi:hypothetical protein
VSIDDGNCSTRHDSTRWGSICTASAANRLPSAGLAGLAFEDSSEEVQLDFGYKKALMFVASLCLANLVLASTFACIGIVARTSEVAVLLGALYALFTLVFSGFLPTSSQMPAALSWLPYLSVLRYTFELVLSNELLGQNVMLVEEWPGSPEAGQPKPVDGATIVNSKDYLGFNPWGEGECPWGGVTLDGVGVGRRVLFVEGIDVDGRPVLRGCSVVDLFGDRAVAGDPERDRQHRGSQPVVDRQ